MTGRRLRVAEAITMLELGGAQRLALYLATHLDPERFETTLFAGPGGPLEAEAQMLLGPRFSIIPTLVREVRPAGDLRALWSLWRHFRRLAPDIVHTHSSKAGILGRWAAALAGVPIVVHTVHGWGFTPNQSPRAQSFFAAIERAGAWVSTRLVAVSAANVAKGVARRVARSDLFTVIRPGVFSESFRAAAGNGRFRAELGLTTEDLLVGMVACFKPQKAPLDFVALAARLAPQFPRAHFVMIGDGELRPAIEKAAADAGLGRQFHLLGWRRDPEQVVGDLDLLVLTSLHEGLPMVVPEAMAAGKPVVATAVDGTPEAVRDGETGFLVPPGDVPAQAEKVRLLLSDSELRQRFSAAASGAGREWDIDLMVDRYAALFSDLARESGG